MKIRVVTIGETFDTLTTKCPSCDRVGTNVDPIYGVLPCNSCKKKLAPRKRKSIQSKLEYYATPLWKLIGDKPNTHERKEEAYRKWRGYSHRDMQVARMSRRQDSVGFKKERGLL